MKRNVLAASVRTHFGGRTGWVWSVRSLVAGLLALGTAPVPALIGTPPVTAARRATPDESSIAAIQQRIARSEYDVRYQPAANAYQGPNRAQGLRATFAAGRYAVQPRRDTSAATHWQVQWTLRGIGRPGQPGLPVVPATPTATGERLTYVAPAYDEVYDNTPAGVRQSFVLHQRPAGPATDSVRVRLALAAPGLRVQRRGGGLDFAPAGGGAVVLTYGDLRCWDAAGQAVGARLRLLPGDSLLTLAVADTGIRYPLTIDPLASTPALRLEGGQNDAFLGHGPAGTGDLNGDGYADLAVGAPFYDNGQPNEGAVFIYYGSSTGLQTVPANAAGAALRLESDQAGATLGWAVAGLGDVNADGYADLAVSAPFYANGETYEGAVFLYYGGATGLQTVPANPARAALRLESDQTGAQLGISVAGAGDLNGDGYADLAAGALYYDHGEPDEGAVFVYYGSSSGLQTIATNPAKAALLLESDQMSAFLSSVAGAGDLNGDGYADLAVGAYGYDNGQTDEGAVFLYYGGATGLQPVTGSPAGAALRLESDQTGAFMGGSVAGAGDLNGDGYADLAVGTSSYDSGENDEGAVFVYYGGATGLQTLATNPAGAALRLESNQISAFLGTSVAGLGDVNGDGYADLAVGAPAYDNGEPNEGAVFVYYGGASGLRTVAANPAGAALHLECDQTAANLGNAVSGAGDVNGDGYADLVAGAPFYNSGETDEGAVFLYYGGAAGLQPLAGKPAGAAQRLESDQASAQLGQRVAGAGDLNGDGYADLAVGAFAYDNGQADEGAVFIYYGGAAGLQTVASNPAGAGQRLESDQAGALLGGSVAGAGDVNGDGYADLAVGAYAYDNGEVNEGAAFLYYGSSTGLQTLASNPAGAALRLESDQTGAFMGYCVAGAGDVNGDGYADLTVGAIYYDHGETDEGVVFVYYGSSTGLQTLASNPAGAALRLESDQISASLGNSVAGAGDLNGDGYADLAVGAIYYDHGETDEGAVFVYYGGGGGLQTAPANPAKAALHFESDQISANLGISVTGAGDVNGDGYTDLAAGAYSYDSGQADEGVVFLYYGGASGLQTVPANPAGAALRLESDQNGAGLGNSVAGAGDLNGDGYADLAVGAPSYDNGEVNEGAVFVYYGAPAGLQTVPATPAGAALRLESDQAGAYLGYCVAGAGDLNGDGYGDLAVGAIYYDDGETDEGAVFVYYGGGSAGASNRDGRLRLYNTDLNTLISAANRPAGQFGLGLRAATPYGRLRARLVWEAVGNGVSFSHNPFITNSTQSSGHGSWTALPTGSVTELKSLVSKAGRATRVRARLEYASAALASGSPVGGTGGVGGQARYGPWQYLSAQQLGQSAAAATPLPVQLSAFSVRAEGPAAARLAWATASEKNAARFEVERSPDGQAFAAIGWRPAQGTKAGSTNYTFRDELTPSSPARPVIYYYRLRQLDLDGTVNYSPVRAVTVGSQPNLALFPNPARGAAALTGALPGTMVTVYDALGRAVTVATVDAAGTAALVLPPGQAAGVYVVRAGAKALRLTIEY